MSTDPAQTDPAPAAAPDGTSAGIPTRSAALHTLAEGPLAIFHGNSSGISGDERSSASNASIDRWIRLALVLTTMLLLSALVAVAVRIALYIHHTLLLFSLGVLVAYALNPLVEGLRHVRVSRRSKIHSRELSVSTVFLLLIGLVVLAGWGIEGLMAAQIRSFEHDYPAYKARALRIAADTDAYLGNHGVDVNLSDKLKHPPSEVKSFATETGKAALPFVGHAFTDVGEGVIVLLIALYFLLYSTELRERTNRLLPAEIRDRVNFWETDVNSILGSFVRGQLLIALAMGVAAAVVCLAMGLHAWLLLGLFVVVTSLIPVFGPYIGAIPALIAAIVGPTYLHSALASGIVIAVLFVVINEVGSKVLYPKLVGAALGLHTVVVLFVLFAGLEIAGVTGVLFAAPFTALAIVTLVHVYRYWQNLPDGLLSRVAQREGLRAAHQPLP